MKDRTDKALGVSMVALLPICCVGLTLVLAAGARGRAPAAFRRSRAQLSPPKEVGAR